jgi:hypothetical protein
VGYEWKNIFKNLLRFDSQETGGVTCSQFEQSCQQAGVINISKDEL